MKINFTKQILDNIEPDNGNLMTWRIPPKSDLKTVKVFSAILDKLNTLGVYVDNQALKDAYPNLEFPDSVDVEVILTLNKDIFEHFGDTVMQEQSYADLDVLGIHAVTNGDGLFGEDFYADKFRVIVMADDKLLEDHINSESHFDLDAGLGDINDLRLGSYLTAYFNTLTHEIVHTLEFIENSGGMTPHDVDVCFDSGDFDYTVQDCSTGENTMSYGEEYEGLDSGDSDDASEIVNIMETRVENKGMDLLNSLSLDLVALYKQEKISQKFSIKSVL